MRVAALFAGLCVSLSTLAQDSLRHVAVRTEIHPVHTLTLSDEEFLKGQGGKVATVTALMRFAQGEGRLPVVVMIHGSGGMGPNIELWTRDFNEMGISTVALDGFTGRGLTNVNTDQARLGRLNMTLDVYRILDILAKHPRVDTSRIILMGFSRGGQGALYASLKRFHKAWNRSGIDFAGYIPFYPDCMTTYQGDVDTVDRPIRIFHGAPDDYNPVTTCKGYVERLRAGGRDVVLTEYPNAPHGFDNPLGSTTPTVAKNAQTVRVCRIRENAEGRLINAGTGQPFTYQDSCVERDPHVGHDPAATQAARAAVREFVKTTFRLN